MGGSPGFFDLDERYAALSASGDPLERLAAVVDFEIFRPLLNQRCAARTALRAAGHRSTRWRCLRS
jgi:hypothetical protein